MKLRWFPNSWVQIVSDDITIYIDPAWVQKHFLNYPGHVIFSKWPNAMDGLPDPKLAIADYIFITHAHKDHYKPETIARLSDSNTKVFGPKKLAKILPNLQIVSPGDSLDLIDLKVEVVDAYNTQEGNSTIKQHKKGECNGYVLAIEGKRIYHSGDTDFIPEMTKINNIDVALIAIGGKFTMDVDEAVQATLNIMPSVVVPIHRLDTDPGEFKLKLASFDSNVSILGIGEKMIL